MFGTIRRHQAWLWWVIGGITVISFVIFGPMNVNRSGRGGGGGGNDSFGMIDSERITRDEFENAYRVVSLDSYLRTGQKLDNSAIATFETYRQLFFLRKQKDLGIQVS